MQAFGEELTEISVMLQDGREIGELQNVSLDLKTGQLENLIVKLRPGASDDLPFQSSGQNTLIPASKVEAVDDYIIVSR